MQNLSDEQVMLNYKGGEAQAMDELLRRYKNPVYHFTCRIMLNIHEAEELTQEVFLKLHEFKDKYKPKGKFSTWIFTIAHNLCISRIRRRKWSALWPANKDNPEDLAEFASPDPSPEQLAESKELTVFVKKCIQGLPFLQKEALILREYQNLGYKEIARILGKPQGTVKTLIHRARQNLKDKFLPYCNELGGGYHE